MDLLLRRVRLVPVGDAAPDGEVDVRLVDGRVAEVGPSLVPRGEVLDADGRWAAPGLWDAHVHLGQWARSRRHLDVGGTASPDEVVARVAAHVATLPDPRSVVKGTGHRSAGWDREPTVAELDAVAGDHPVVLVSGDAHNGWLSSAALRQLGLPARDGLLLEQEWFRVLARLDDVVPEPDLAGCYRDAVEAANRLGVVGLLDVELDAGPSVWDARVEMVGDRLHVRVATYPDTLDEVVARGLRTGDPLGARTVMGPLKVIFDGSLGTATAWCCDPYGRAGGRGVLNLSPAELTDLLARATAAGLDVAVHAIGDAAVRSALDAIEASGARGSVEHAQLVATADLRRFAALGVVASVQPAHLLDDRDTAHHLWADRADRCFPLGSLLRAGATLALGSDAPVAPLDPWLAMAAAVHRSADDREPWNPAEHLTPAQALAASTAGRRTLAPGAAADVVLLDDDPLAPASSTAAAAARLRSVRVATTVVGGDVVHDAR